MVIRALIRICWDVLVTGWLIIKETAFIWLPSFAVAFGILSLVGGSTCVR